MVFCCAFGCSNYDKHRKDGVSFHRFPKNEELRRRWVAALRLQSLPENYEKAGEFHGRDMLDLHKRRRVLRDRLQRLNRYPTN